MPFGYSDTFELQVVSPWQLPQATSQAIADDWKHDPAKKKLFGVALTKHENPFDAATEVFFDPTHAYWASQHWLTDPVVLAAKDAQNTAAQRKLLDRDGLLHKLLEFADEKDASNRFYLNEAKDRLAALKLYAEIQQLIGKVDIDASVKNFTNNTMKIVFVKPNDNQKQNSVIDAEPAKEVEHKLPANIKLVSSG